VSPVPDRRAAPYTAARLVRQRHQASVGRRALSRGARRKIEGSPPATRRW
jgi:hypothetical protein